MEIKKVVYKELLLVALGVLLCSGIMVGIYALIGRFSLKVLLSALCGSMVIILNHVALAVTVSKATKKAQEGDPKGAQTMVSMSSLVRLLVMGVMLFAGVKLGGDVLALVLPLVFLRPVLMVGELFRKKGD